MTGQSQTATPMSGYDVPDMQRLMTNQRKQFEDTMDMVKAMNDVLDKSLRSSLSIIDIVGQQTQKLQDGLRANDTHTKQEEKQDVG